MRRALALSLAGHLLLALLGVGAGALAFRARPASPPHATAEMIFVDPGNGHPGAASGAPAAPVAPPTSLAPAAPPEPPAPPPAPPETAAAEPVPPDAPPRAQEAAPPARQAEASDAAEPPAAAVRLGDNAAGSTSDVEDSDIPAGPDPAAPNIPPRYPPDAVRHGEEGVVVLEVAVAPDGDATGVGVYLSSGFVRLDRAAREAVLRWRFRPKLDGGEPIASRTLIRVRFRLE